jgi:uncharacterized protein
VFERARITANDIQTASFNVSILRNYSENVDPTAVTGFEITNQLRVTVRDINQLGELLEPAVNAGTNSIYGVNFYVDDRTAAVSEARVEAVKDARTNAEELAASAGMTLGPVIAMSEGVAPITYPVSPKAQGGVGEGLGPWCRSSRARRRSRSA